MRRARPVTVPTSRPRSAMPGRDAVEQLGRVRPGTHARRVRLHDPDDLVDLQRPDAAARARAAGHRVGRGHERVAPVVEVEERALGALEQHVLAARQGGLDEPGRVVEVLAQPLAPAGGQVDERVDLEGLGAHRPEDQVLVRQRARDPLAQDRPIEQVLHAQARAATRGRRRRGRCRGRSCRPSRPPSRASFAWSRATWYGMITCALRLTRTRSVEMPRAVSMSNSAMRVTGLTTTPLPITRRDVRVEHARRRQLELEDLVPADDGVAGVVATLVAHDHGRLLGQEVGRLALALVAPLQPDDHGSRHQRAAYRESAREAGQIEGAGASKGASCDLGSLRERPAEPGNARAGRAS